MSAIAALYEAAGDPAGRVALDKAWAKFRGFTLPAPRQDDDLGVASLQDTRAALKTAIGHIEHMASWISKQNAGYSFEGLGEDMGAIRAAAGAP